MDFFKKYIKNRFFNKLLLFFISITTLTFLALSFIIGSSVSKVMIDKELEYNDVLLYNMNKYMEEKYKLIQTVLYQAYMEKNFISDVFYFLNNELHPYSDEYAASKPAFDNYLDSFFTRDTDLTAINVYKLADQRIYQYTKFLSNIYTAEEFYRSEMIGQVNENVYPTVNVYPADYPDYLQATNNRRVFSLSLNIKTTDSTKNSGVLMLDFDTNGFHELLSRFNLSLNSHLMILMADGEVVFDSSGQYYKQKYPYLHLIDKTRTAIRIDNEKNVINKLVSQKTGLLIVSISPEKNVLALANRMRITIYLLSVICIIVCILLMVISSNFLSKRIKIIIHAMKLMRNGNLSVRIPNRHDQEDEIGQIAVNLNRMSEHLSEHIEKSYISELKQKNAELTALQAQINPHFLYNTLEAIRMKAVSTGDKETGQMIYILAEMFRSSIKSDTVISVEDEIRQCEQYLQLFKIRYGDSFTYCINVEDSVRSCGFIKHLLQPILENYIVHGFSPRARNNRITLIGTRQGDNLIFTVEDNGRGIPAHKLVEIQEQLAKPNFTRGKSIGLANVHERVKIIFGKDYGLTLYSETNKATKAVITIPAMSPVELSEYVQSINR